MTEAEWLGSIFPPSMLAFIRGKTTDRKLRLFACACCRRISELFWHEKLKELVEISESHIDHQATDEELSRVVEAADCLADSERDRLADSERPVDDHASLIAYDVGQALYCLVSPGEGYAIAASTADWAHRAVVDSCRERDVALDEWKAQTHVLHDILGNPFRPVAPNPTWRTRSVANLAQAIYEGPRFDDLPILADALEDAGCDNADILAHCRGPGPHVRGCWVIDLLLGKE
jgi:hypothetical protein